MDISSDLSFKSGVTYSAATNLERCTFENKASVISAATFPTSLYMVSGELYFNDNSGNQVQVTNEGAVNVSSAGGITGTGYGSSDVEVNWDSGATAYRFRSGPATDDFASVYVNDVLLGDGSGNAITLAAPSISGDYTVTLPAAAPASTSVVEMDSSGVLTADPTSVHRHGEKTLLLGMFASRSDGSGVTTHFDIDEGWVAFEAAVAAHFIVLDIPLCVGDRIKSIKVRHRCTLSTGSIEATLKNSVDETDNDVATASYTGTSTAWRDLDLSSIDHTILSSRKYFLKITGLGTSGDVLVDHVEVVYDRP
jgi:hypothetical protein